MSPDFIKGLDMLRQMQSLTGCCDTQPPVVVYRDRPAQSQPAAAVPAGGDYSAWVAFQAGHIREWLTLDQLRAECGRLATAGAPSPELLLSHAMRLLDAPAAAVPDGWVLPIGPHDHPDPHVMVWSETELRSIRAYAARCVAAMLAAAPQAPQQAAERPTLGDLIAALRQAREALALPCDRWNAVQSRIVREALATVDAVLRDAPPATPVA